VHLGIPVLVYAALSLTFGTFVFHEKRNWNNIFDAAHLWYLEHVLLFSIVYAIWRHFRGQAYFTVRKNPARPAPGLLVTLAAALGVAVLCWLVRQWSPVDRWTHVLGFFSVAFADVPRDLAFFIFGAMAFHRGWFEQYPTRRGMIWLAVALVAAAAWYVKAFTPYRSFGNNSGGPVYVVWEEIICFGFCIGLLVLFRQVVKSQGRFGKMLAANQYSVYFWHLAMVQQIQRLVHTLSIGPLAKFGLVAAVALPLVFLWSALMRRIPAVRAVL